MKLKSEKVDENRNENLHLKHDNLDAHHDDDLDDNDNGHLQPQEQPALRTKCGRGGSDRLWTSLRSSSQIWIKE